MNLVLDLFLFPSSTIGSGRPKARNSDLGEFFVQMEDEEEEENEDEPEVHLRQGLPQS